MDYAKLITIDPARRSGKACVRNLRITVYDVLSYLAAGMTIEEILADFPDLTHDDILACLAFAASNSVISTSGRGRLPEGQVRTSTS